MRHMIKGTCHPRFSEVRSVFEDNFNILGEVGASVCVWYRGERVIDLWGGYRDLNARDPWSADELVNLFSVTKGLVATCFLMLVDRGLIRYEDPVSRYWPELIDSPICDFKASRQEITIADLLNHRAGLLGFRERLSLEELEDESLLLHRLERERLYWPSGSEQGYHGVSFGLYTSALFKKITGRSLGEFLRTEVTGPLGLDLYLGLTEEEEARLRPRLAPIFPNQLSDLLCGVLPNVFLRSNNEGRFYRGVLRSGSPGALAFGQPAELGARGLNNFNTARVRRLELPWANAQGSARGVAGLYQALLQEGKLIRSDSLEYIKPRQTWVETDLVLRKPMGFSYGFAKEERHLFSPNPESFGHPGAGGALGWADPTEELAIGYVMNRMGYQVRSPRALALCHAIYRCI